MRPKDFLHFGRQEPGARSGGGGRGGERTMGEGGEEEESEEDAIKKAIEMSMKDQQK